MASHGLKAACALKGSRQRLSQKCWNDERVTSVLNNVLGDRQSRRDGVDRSRVEHQAAVHRLVGASFEHGNLAAVDLLRRGSEKDNLSWDVVLSYRLDMPKERNEGQPATYLLERCGDSESSCHSCDGNKVVPADQRKA